jgi:hypothetical protein
MALPLAMTTSDHIPYVISIQTFIPKTSIFRFENRWLQMIDFLSTVEKVWTQSIHYADVAKGLLQSLRSLERN